MFHCSPRKTTSSVRVASLKYIWKVPAWFYVCATTSAAVSRNPSRNPQIEFEVLKGSHFLTQSMVQSIFDDTHGSLEVLCAMDFMTAGGGPRVLSNRENALKDTCSDGMP